MQKLRILIEDSDQNCKRNFIPVFHISHLWESNFYSSYSSPYYFNLPLFSEILGSLGNGENSDHQPEAGAGTQRSDHAVP